MTYPFYSWEVSPSVITVRVISKSSAVNGIYLISGCSKKTKHGAGKPLKGLFTVTTIQSKDFYFFVCLSLIKEMKLKTQTISAVFLLAWWRNLDMSKVRITTTDHQHQEWVTNIKDVLATFFLYLHYYYLYLNTVDIEILSCGVVSLVRKKNFASYKLLGTLS